MSPGPKVQPKRSTLDLAGRVQQPLQLEVQRPGAEPAAVHRAQHLDVADRVEPEPGRDAPGHDLQQLGHAVLRVVAADEVEVAAGLLARLGQQALVDPVRVGDDPALGRLPEHLGQPDHRHRARGDDVGQHLPRPDRGQLVDVADQEQGRPARHRLEQRVHQRHVDHRDLVHDQQVALERVLLVALEAALGRVGLEQAVQGPGLAAGGLAQPLGGPAGRCGQGDGRRLGRQDLEDGVDQRGLADARARR